MLVGCRMGITIRKYEPKDRESIRKIFNDTAFFGAPIETYFSDRAFFADFFTLYYTDYEQESVFVAEDINRREVVGYLTGCINTVHMKEFFYPKASLKLLPGLFRKTVIFDKKSLSYLIGLLRSGIKGENSQDKFFDYNRFPSHLHMNIRFEYRDQGIGSRLIQAFFAYLREKNVYGVHLGVFSVNEEAIKFYKKYGFYEFSRCRTTLYDNFFPNRDIYLIYMVKHLSEEGR